MSLFGDVFKHEEEIKGGLFSASNPFISHNDSVLASVADALSGSAKQQQSLGKNKKGNKRVRNEEETSVVSDKKEKQSKKSLEKKGEEPLPSDKKASATEKPEVEALLAEEKTSETGKKNKKKGKEENIKAVVADEKGSEAKPDEDAPKANSAPKPEANAESEAEVEEETEEISDEELTPTAEAPAAAEVKVPAEEKKPKLTPEEEAAKLRRTVFIGNVPATATRKDLQKIFKQFGAVESVRMRSVPVKMDAKMPRKAAILSGKVDVERGAATAYLVFKEEEAVTSALKANMMMVGDHHIRVDRAVAAKPRAKAKAAAAGADAVKPTPRQEVKYDPPRSVFVGNLGFQVKDEELIRFFLEGSAGSDLRGQLEAVRIVRDAATNVGKGIAFALFKTKSAAHAALALDGETIGKRAVRVTRVSNSAGLKGSSSSSRSSSFGPKNGGGGGAGGFKVNGQTRIGQSDPGAWQGARTKGVAKGLRGPKAAAHQQQRGPPTGGNSKGGRGKPAPPENRIRLDKRPSVAARRGGAGKEGAPGGFKGKGGAPGGFKDRAAPRTGGAGGGFKRRNDDGRGPRSQGGYGNNAAKKPRHA